MCDVGCHQIPPCATDVAVGPAVIGSVDILINNAGVTQRIPIWELSMDDFDRLLSINLRGGLFA